MARARNIKPALFKNEILGVADPIYTLLFSGLWLLADREGRLEDRPLRIKAELFPYRDGMDMPAMLGWLHDSGFIYRYSYGENRYIEIANFTKHQNPHKNEAASEIPSVSIGCISTDKIGTNTDKIGSAPADSLSLDLLIPDSLSLDSLNTDSKTLTSAVAPSPAKKPRKPKDLEAEAAKEINRETWRAYADSYFNRYGAEPVRNAKSNALVAQLVQRLGAEEAPDVAFYYVTINDAFYLRTLHDLGNLVAKCESIRTQWATGRQMTGTTARQMENTQSNMTAAEEAKRMLREGGTQNAFLAR
jgi:hypothetical protein